LDRDSERELNRNATHDAALSDLLPSKGLRAELKALLFNYLA
jgi:hypothetical protein